MTDKFVITCAYREDATGLFHFTPFWRDFIHKACHEDRGTDEILAEYNAVQTEYGTRYWQVEFDTQQDCVMFLLRWS